MKKVLFLLGGALAIFTSCKKDYTCTCTYSYYGYTLQESYEYTNMKEDAATDACNTQLAVSGYDACTLTEK